MKRNIKLISLVITAILLVGAVIGISVSADTAEASATPGVRIAGQNMAYEGAVQVLYLVETKNTDLTPALLISDAEFTAPANISELAEGVTLKECPTDNEGKPLTIEANGKVYYALFSDGIGAVNMRSPIYATPVLVAEDGAVTAGKQNVYSPWQYAVNRFDAEPSKAQLALYTAMLDYAASVQDLFMNEEEITAAGGWADAYYRAAFDYTWVNGSLRQSVSDWQRDPFVYDTVVAPVTYNGLLFVGYKNGQQADYKDYRYYDLEVNTPGTNVAAAYYQAYENNLPRLYKETGIKRSVTSAKSKTATNTTGDYFVMDFDLEYLTNGDYEGQGERFNVNMQIGDFAFEMSPFWKCSDSGVIEFYTHDAKRISTVAADGKVGLSTSHTRIYKTLEGALSNNSQEVVTKIGINRKDIKNVRIEVYNRGAERTESFTYTDAAGVQHKMTQKLYVPELYIYFNGELIGVTVDTKQSQYTATVVAGADGAEDTVELHSKYSDAYAAGQTASLTQQGITLLKDSKAEFNFNNWMVTARSYNDTYDKYMYVSNILDFENGTAAQYAASGVFKKWDSTPLYDPEAIVNGTTGVYVKAMDGENGNSYLQVGRAAKTGGEIYTSFFFEEIEEEYDTLVFEVDFKIVALGDFIGSSSDKYAMRFRFGEGTAKLQDASCFAAAFVRGVTTHTSATDTEAVKGINMGSSSAGNDAKFGYSKDENGIASSEWVRLRIVWENTENKAGKIYINDVYVGTTSNKSATMNGKITNVTIDTRSHSMYSNIQFAVDNMRVYGMKNIESAE